MNVSKYSNPLVDPESMSIMIFALMDRNMISIMGEVFMTDLNVKVDSWKNKLLDMGKRNKLLNYKETKRGTLRFKAPNVLELWNNFVVEEKPIVFPLVDEEDETCNEELTYDNKRATELIKDDSSQSEIKTTQSIKEQQRTLRSLRNKSKQVMEEQGINVLYLSFGFLRWIEADSSKQEFDAPLVLVPVSLTWESISAPFVLSLHEDEIVLNPTITYKLEHDFGIILPEYTGEDTLETYLKAVEELVKNNNWSVIRESSLGMLSFLKINMYHDLENHKDTILNNPIICAIGGDAASVQHDISGIDDFDYDNNTKPDQVFQVVDADSSQQDAILCAKEGISFVLQGPPGTGKSQTITNIIAECLADGKKVLFVSEKVAALDVVYNRLKNANLDDFCLVLHSHKANKKQTMEQLGNMLQLAQKKASLSQETYQKLDRLLEDRKKLNNYAEELHHTIEPLHTSIFGANGILASVNDYDDIIFPIKDIRKVTHQQYMEYLGVLRRLADNINMMKMDYHVNPWRGASVSFVSNELRHDINSRFPGLISHTNELNKVIIQIQKSLFLTVGDFYSSTQLLLKILMMAKDCQPFSKYWILNDETEPLLSEVDNCSKIKEDFIQKRNHIRESIKTIQRYDNNLEYNITLSLISTQAINDFQYGVVESINNDACYSVWSHMDNLDDVKKMYKLTKEKISKYIDIKKSISDEYEKEIFEIPYNEIYFRYKECCSSFLKIFKSQYRNDKKLFKSYRKQNNTKISDQDVLDVLNRLRDLQETVDWMKENADVINRDFPNFYSNESTNFEEIENHLVSYKLLCDLQHFLRKLVYVVKEHEEKEELLKKHYESLYYGIETQWEDVKKSLYWFNIFKNAMGEQLSNNEVFINNLHSNKDFSDECQKYAVILKNALESFEIDYKWFVELFEDKNTFDNIRLISLVDRLQGCSGNLATLEEWIDFCNSRKECSEKHLGEYVQEIADKKISSENIIPIFQKRFYRLWLDSVLPEHEAVANFRKIVQEAAVDEFKSLDKLQFSIAKSRIRFKLINSLPSMNNRFTNGIDEISTLKRELSKQRKIMPIRKLFKQIPNLIMTLKPCLMMSPLSVSLFLESDNFVFDTVIFDEASQVCTENAIGAIFRGKQVIIAGDSKQLPPTSFFTAAVSENDFDYDSDTEEEVEDNVYESILDEASLLPERTLLWHYRSRHEHLIAFSNAKIYQKNLITFPSNVDKAQDVGVEYVYVKDGYYDRGGRRGNEIEAKKVAEMVFEHFQKFSNRSLGVITFGEAQQVAIDTELRKMRMEDQSFENCFSDEKKDPFFIKSLENVQGDERDTIIFSIGYAKDANGVMKLNFGPLGKAGGERRLNVAITRAKYNIKLVGSILPTDIDLSRLSMDGPKLLRSYMEFAINGPASLTGEITEIGKNQFDSPFEEAVFNFLDRKGYKLTTQVGCSGYRIDMAIKHPTLCGRYVLGIECDGATYHSARTARERDRLRQDVLENMGWKIYRIWSTDWIKDPITEGKRLVEVIENALESYAEDEQAILVNKKNQNVDWVSDNNFLKEEIETISEGDSANPYSFDTVPSVTFNGLQKDWQGYLQMEDCVEHIIQVSYPIHFEEICQRCALPLGREKVTSVVRSNVQFALKKIASKYYMKNDFYFLKTPKGIDIKALPVRQAGNRPIKLICNEEFAAGMYRVISECVGITKEGAILETTRAFGFNRRGNNITVAMNNAFEFLVKNKIIEVLEGKVLIKKE